MDRNVLLIDTNRRLERQEKAKKEKKKDPSKMHKKDM